MNPPISKTAKQKKISKHSREVKSTVIIFCKFVFKPNATLNQHLQNPKIPKKLALIAKINNEIGVNSSKPEKIYNSHKNFNVPGNPE